MHCEYKGDHGFMYGNVPIPNCLCAFDLMQCEKKLLGGIVVTCRALIQSKGDELGKYCEVI